MQSLNVTRDAPVAFAAAPLQLVLETIDGARNGLAEKLDPRHHVLAGDWSAQVKTLEISVEAHFSVPVSWSQLMRVERLPAECIVVIIGVCLRYLSGRNGGCGPLDL